MTYDPTIPTGQISPKDQVTQVQTNFSQFGTVFANNHTAFNTAKQGCHEKIIMAQASSVPPITEDLVNFFALNATSHTGTQPQLFFQIPRFLPTPLDPNDPGNPGVQLTSNTVNTVGPVYQSFLPGGLLLYFGSVSALGTVSLSPAPSAIIIAIATANNMTTVGTFIPFDVSTNIINNFQFNINSSIASGAFTYTWMAIAAQ